MKTTLLMTMALFLMSTVPALADQSDADKVPPHFKYSARKGRKVVVHGRGPVVVAGPVVHHRHAVVVHSAPVVVHTTKVVPVHERRVVENHGYVAARRDEDSMLGIGLRLSGTSVDGQQLNLATVENPSLWGAGVQVRGKVSESVGIEVGADWLSGQTDEMTQTSVPLMLSVMYYFIPDGGVRLYGLVGGGANFTTLEYNAGFRHDDVELAAQAGGGLELRLSPEFGLSADLRFMGLYKDMGSSTTLRNDCLSQVGGNTGFCNGLNNLDPNDKLNVGAQFMVGANLYF